jgi:hypothetical protein
MGVQVPLGHTLTYMLTAHAHDRTCPVHLVAGRRHDLKALHVVTLAERWTALPRLTPTLSASTAMPMG